MTEPKNPFDDIIQKKLSNFELPSSGDDWLQMEMDLNKKSFWKWGSKHFNIYYSATLALLITLSTFLILNNTTSEKNQNNTPIDSTNTSDSMIERSSEFNSPENENKKLFKKFPNPFKKRPDSLSNQTPILLKDTADIDTRKDSFAAPKQQIPQDTTKKQPVKKPKKVVYISKRDTVFTADTLRKVRRK